MPKHAFGVLPLATSVITLAFGITSAIRRRKQSANLIFAALCLSVSVWSFFYSQMYLHDESSCLFFARLGYVGVVFIPVFSLHFILSYTGYHHRLPLILAYTTSLVFLPLSQTPLFLRASQQYFWGSYPLAGPAYIYFVLYFGCTFAACVFYLLLCVRNERDHGLRSNQLKFMFLAFAIASTSVVDYIPNYGISIYPWGYLSAFGWIAVIGYSILRHRLMDFGLIMRWGIAYAILLSIVSGFVGVSILVSQHVIARLVHFSGGFITIVLISSLVFVFDPLKQRITRFVDLIIFRSPDFETVLSGIKKNIGGDYRLLLPALADAIRSMWGVTHVGLGIWDLSNASFQLLPQSAFEQLPISRLHEKITRTDFLIRTIETERRLFRNGIVAEDEVTALGNRSTAGERTTFWKIRRTMRWLGASICVPVMDRDQLKGFLVLGAKKANAMYNEEDKKFLAHVASLLSDAPLQSTRDFSELVQTTT